MRWLLLGLCALPACHIVFALPDRSMDGIDAGILDADPSDLDNDTVPNADDNCPMVPNKEQDNEDGDPRGNACDECPHLPSVLVMDEDGDGVGDDCDPRPFLPDRIAYFDGFDRPVLSPRWSPTIDSWVVSNGTLRGEAAAGSLLELDQRVDGAMGVEAGVTTETAPTASGSGVAIDISSGIGRLCGMVNNAAEIRQGLFNTATLNSEDSDPSGQVAQTYRYRATALGANRSCFVDGAPPTGIVAPAPHAGVAGLFVRSSAATFDYFLLIVAQ